MTSSGPVGHPERFREVGLHAVVGMRPDEVPKKRFFIGISK